MSGQQQSGWADNAFTFSESEEMPFPEPQPFGIDNWLKDFFEKLKAKFVQKPPAPIDSQEEIGTEGWRPEMGMSRAKYDTFAPDPGFIPITQRRKPVITQEGIKGWNTHYNIMVDKSGSMSRPSTTYQGKSCDRTIVARLAVSCLVKQASFNLDSFTLYDYNGQGSIVWPTDGTPAYNYEDCIAWLTSESISSVWNIVENNAGTVSSSWTNSAETSMVNSLAPFPPGGSNNENAAFDVMVKNCITHNITGMITVFFTDGDEISNKYMTGAFERTNVTDLGKGMIGPTKTYDEWLRQFGHLFYIILQGEKEMPNIRKYVHNTESHLMELYGWTREEASQFVWGFPNDNMLDDAGELITKVEDQMAWLFAEIGRISAGLSKQFDDLAIPLDAEDD